MKPHLAFKDGIWGCYESSHQQSPICFGTTAPSAFDGYMEFLRGCKLMMGMPICEIGFSTRVRCELGAAGVLNLSDLLCLSYEDLMSIDGVGASSVAEIAEKLNELGLPPLRDWFPSSNNPYRRSV